MGFDPRPGKGSHTVLRKGSVVVVVPHQNPIRPGTLRNILKQAQVSSQDLAANL